MRRAVAIGGLALAALAVGISSQAEDKPGKRGRVRFKRDQGSKKVLKKTFEELLRGLRASAPEPTSRPVKPSGGNGADQGDGLEPPGRRPRKADGDEKGQDEEKDGQEKEETKPDRDPHDVLRSFAPTQAALKDAFTPEGLDALGKPLLTGAKRLFGGEADAIATRLGIKPELSQVSVFEATTEDFLGMDIESVAAKEFASGLRATARYLKPRYVWYAVVLRRPGETNPRAATRLQLFFHHKGRYVLLGRIWRLDKIY